MGKSFIRSTVSGTAFDLANPKSEMIRISDIGWHLSMINRWCGNIRRPYSVAQHSVLVARAIADPAWRIYGLLHDAGEAYTGDIITPLKEMIVLGGFDVVGAEQRILQAVFESLSLPTMSRSAAAAVDRADRQLLATEYRDVVHTQLANWSPEAAPLPEVIVPMSSANAFRLFMDEFEECMAALR